MTMNKIGIFAYLAKINFEQSSTLNNSQIEKCTLHSLSNSLYHMSDSITFSTVYLSSEEVA